MDLLRDIIVLFLTLFNKQILKNWSYTDFITDSYTAEMGLYTWVTE